MDCESCPTVHLDDGNAQAWAVISTAAPMLFFPGGAINPAAVEMAFRICQVDTDDQGQVLRMVQIYAEEALEAAKDKRT
jgi:hypothetical protein